jgi:hypothetical protein
VSSEFVGLITAYQIRRNMYIKSSPVRGIVKDLILDYEHKLLEDTEERLETISNFQLVINLKKLELRAMIEEGKSADTLDEKRMWLLRALMLEQQLERWVNG